MSRVRVLSFGVSLDGYGAGPDQDLENPLGVGGTDLHAWIFARAYLPAHASAGRRAATPASTTISRERGFANIGAWILGRNMFGPVRGPWPDDSLEGLVGRRTRRTTCRCSC